MMKLNPTLEEFLKTRLETENEIDKLSVVVEHFSKGKTGRFVKTILFFLCGNNENSYKVEVTGKRVSLGDEEGLQIPCKLLFTGDAKYIDKLKDILPTLL